MSRLSWAIVGGAFSLGWAMGPGELTKRLPLPPIGFRWEASNRLALADGKGVSVGDILQRVTLVHWTGRMASAEVNAGFAPNMGWLLKAVKREANNLIRHVSAAMALDPWHEARLDELVEWSHGLPKISVA